MQNIRRRMRFGDNEDLVLLREALGLNPYLNPDVWDIIQEHVRSLTGKTFAIRSLKEHLELLIKQWLKENDDLKDRSGIEIELTEKNRLCQEVYELMKEFNNKAKKRKKKISLDGSKSKGIDARDKFAMQNVQKNMYILPEECTVEKDVILDEEVGEEVIYLDHDYLDQQMDVIPNDFLSVESVDNTAGPSTIQNLSPVPEHTKKRTVETKTLNNLPTAKSKEDPPGIINGDQLSVKKRKTPEPLVLARRKKGKTRQENVQREGLSYLEEFDRKQNEIKDKEIKLEERKVALEEKKLALAEKQFDLSAWETKKKMELREKQLEIENRKFLMSNIEKQDKLIDFLLKDIRK